MTGGAGFIGSTVCSALIDNADTPVIIDDLSQGRREFAEGRIFYKGDIGDVDLLNRIWAEHPDIGAVVHCAAKIVVPESVADPLGYYDNNIAKAITFLRFLTTTQCTRFVFSSSASIYAPADDWAVDEHSPLSPNSPYATTKFMLERILEDVTSASRLRVLSLRYFNPIGADPELRTGLQAQSPTHALGRLLEGCSSKGGFTITGVQWDTRDGSGIRDYIHVWDLADAHVKAVHRFDQISTLDTPYQVINLGTGAGTTVRELVAAFIEVTGSDLAVTEGPPRPGDVAGCYTRSQRAANLLGWSTTQSIADGIRDSIAWEHARKDMLGY